MYFCIKGFWRLSSTAFFLIPSFFPLIFYTSPNGSCPKVAFFPADEKYAQYFFLFALYYIMSPSHYLCCSVLYEIERLKKKKFSIDMKLRTQNDTNMKKITESILSSLDTSRDFVRYISKS